MEIWTDGSCVGVEPRRIAGYGVAFRREDNLGEDISQPLRDDPQTNQRAELMAILAALQRLDNHRVPASTPVTIYTDSSYSINCICKWRASWEKNGWLTAKKEPVKNCDLIVPISKLYDKRAPALRLQWVKGHSTNEGNNRADLLATKAAATAAAAVL